MPRIADPKDYRKLGRPVSVDITPHKMMADDYQGEWVAEEYSEAHATSARRQFKNLGGYEVMTAKAKQPGHRTVLVRRTTA